MQDLLNEEEFKPVKPKHNYFKIFMASYLIPVILCVFIIAFRFLIDNNDTINTLLSICFILSALVSPLVMVSKKESNFLRKRWLAIYILILLADYILCTIIKNSFTYSTADFKEDIATIIATALPLTIYYIFIITAILFVRVYREAKSKHLNR